MKRCPITYEKIIANKNYSEHGLHLLSKQLKNLYPLSLSADEQRKEAIARVGKMSIQGVQPKLSAQLKIKDEHFEIVDEGGAFILKPQSDYYPELPENEAISMTLAAMIGLEVPVHGLVYAKDHTMTYFIKRFDRLGRNKKLAVEDFTQLLDVDRDTKYESSMEEVAKVISEFCTFPAIEFVKLFKLTLFNFLIGNEDMHLKNFSLITRDKKIMLSPCYDLLNSTIVLDGVKEEVALPLNGKKSNLRRKDVIDYFAVQGLGLNNITIDHVIKIIQEAIPKWQQLIANSFLSKPMQKKYIDLLSERKKILEL
jgi:serine/threonine-protein kinase HipA